MTPDGPRTITAAAELIRRGDLTPSELLEQCLARIDRYELRVKAWVVVDRDGAREQAARLTAELKAGTNRGPLHGIPVGIKDIIDVFDLPTGCGSKLWANSVARQDATCVSRLRQAGAVIVGKTVTTAFAFLDPPPTRNPWNLERTPGGSSSGSAAAVACGMCLGALGTQTGGSLTRPASFCGVYSLKPTHGRVSTGGVLPFAPSLDHIGFMANCVRDLVILFHAAAGPDPQLRFTLSGNATVPDCLAAIDGRSVEFHSALLTGLFDDLPTSEMRTLFDRAVRRGESKDFVGDYVVPPPAFSQVHAAHRIIMAVEAAAFHGARLARRPDDYPPQITKLIEDGLQSPGVAYRLARVMRDDLENELQKMLNGIRVIVTPATTSLPPDPDTTGNPAMNAPWSFTGQPTVSVPVGWSPEGLPFAAQLVGTTMLEDDLLAAAAWYERAFKFDCRPLPLD
jgi:Asp-tRNA(Asn)/Glu-tRNA(Gln) amidotransferase A subunit family amidase